MLIEIPNVLGEAQLDQVKKLILQATFVDGKISAGMAAKQVKNNEELEANTQITQQLDQLVLGNLVRHPIYKNAAFAKRVAGAFYARYNNKMHYGDHVDDPIMGPPGGQYRTDVSTTVFLTEPDEYEGGELVIRSTFGEKQYKIKAGNAVMYPSSSLHHVNPVTSGERVVAVTWAQSMIADPAKRELLYNLNTAREALLKQDAKNETAKLVDISFANLVRMWADV
jgi:PKHD-type hydroxylase